MKAIYHGTYQLFYNLYYSFASPKHAIGGWLLPFPRESDPLRLSAEIRAMIDIEASEQGIEERLRPDAKLFLLLNLHQMIVMPFLFNKAETDDRVREQLTRDLKSDVKSILQETKGKSDQPEFDRNEISAHQIMKIIDFRWSDLRVSRLDMWG